VLLKACLNHHPHLKRRNPALAHSNLNSFKLDAFLIMALVFNTVFSRETTPGDAIADRLAAIEAVLAGFASFSLSSKVLPC
jgi:hypothetical protein